MVDRLTMRLTPLGWNCSASWFETASGLLTMRREARISASCQSCQYICVFTRLVGKNSKKKNSGAGGGGTKRGLL